MPTIHNILQFACLQLNLNRTAWVHRHMIHILFDIPCCRNRRYYHKTQTQSSRHSEGNFAIQVYRIGRTQLSHYNSTRILYHTRLVSIRKVHCFHNKLHLDTASLDCTFLWVEREEQEKN